MIKRGIDTLKRQLRPLKRRVVAEAAHLDPIVRRATLPGRLAIRAMGLRAQLRWILAARRPVVLPRAANPELSVVLVAEDEAEFLLASLRSVVANRGVASEVIVVDNATQGRTRRLLTRLSGATVVRVADRLPREQASHRAVAAARGEFLAFLDPDSWLGPDSLATALATARSRPTVGSVVGMTIQVDGTLEEAGSILWADGSSSPFGPGQSPHEPEFMFIREVDFSVGGFLLVRRAAAEEFLAQPSLVSAGDGLALDRIVLGAHLRASGLATYYDPRVVVRRLRASEAGADRLLAPDPARVAARLGSQLHAQLPRTESNLYPARNRSSDQRRILYIDDRIPHLTLGAGFPRTRRIVAEMVRLGYFVTYYPTNYPIEACRKPEPWSEVYQCLDRHVEVMKNHSSEQIADFLAERAGYYDVILISRPHNMEKVKPFLPTDQGDGRPRIVYDAEALFSARAIEQMRLSNNEPTAAQQSEMIAAEVRLVDGCAAVLSVSEQDARNFAVHGAREVFTLSHCVDAAATPSPFERRAGFLFVGPLNSGHNSNTDAVTWFIAEVFPRLRDLLGDKAPFRVAGTIKAPELLRLGGNGVELLGRVEDLAPVYDAARVFVAPARYAAGIPLKCIEAAAQGVPIVTTRLLADQLGWQDEVELLVADSAASFADRCAQLYRDPELWGRLRANALERIEQSYSPQSFATTLMRTVGAVAGPVS